MTVFKKILIICLLVLSTVYTYSQISYGGTPPSFDAKGLTTDIDKLHISSPDMNTIMIEDTQDEKNGEMMKIARLLDVNASIDNSGTWSTLEDGTEIWQLSLTSKGAKALALHFEKFNVPPGAKVFVYDSEHKQVLGSFNHNNNRGDIEFSIGIVLGDEIIIEYVAPSLNEKKDGYYKQGLNTVSEPEIIISRLSYIYRGVELMEQRLNGKDYGDSEWCEVDINCPEGADFQDEKRGVARIYAVDGYSAGWCTGSLVNNYNEDGTPYFLTADHCGGSASTTSLNQWIFYFNYEGSTCGYSGSEPSYNSITGCSRVARAPLDGGSDFLLLELNNTPPSNYNVVYNGWRANNYGGTGGVGIHHPYGDIKKISTYTATPQTSTYYGQNETGASNAHWTVYWVETTTNHGVTEGGSSGSPLFDSNGIIFGTLSGGSSYCNSPNSADLYGKFSYHWTSNGSSSSEQLEPWLGNGTTEIGMYDPNNTGVNAQFTASPTTVSPGGVVQFTNQSTGNPTGYSWSFPGGSPNSSNAVNPSITYNTVGTYNVSLTVTGSGSSDTETKNGYITVIEGATAFSLDFEACTDFQVDNFAPWTTYDGDESGTYGAEAFDFDNENYTGSFIAFNHDETNPVAGDQWIAHGGQRCGICFAATNYPNNDWLISPQISLQNNSSLSLWAKSVTDQYGLERFKVLVSTTNNNPSSFTQISSGSYTEAPLSWTEYTYNLSAYNNSEIYIAIQCVSNDAFAFMIDDIEIFTEGGSTGSAPVANFYGTPTNTNVGGQVSFFDQSSNSPTAWDWTFTGGSPNASQSQNPTVTYNSQGTYNVSLTASNQYGSNTMNKSGYITVSQGGGECETLHYPLNGSEALYTVEGGGGYVAGNNTYGDLAKADYFDYTGIGYVTKMTVHIGAVEGTSGNVIFRVWSNSGGTPGSALGSKTVTMSSLSSNFSQAGDEYTVTFDSPIEVNGDFFAGIVLPTTGSTFAVMTNTEGDGPNTAWEMWSDQTWIEYDNENSWNIALTHAIFPEVCPNLSSLEIPNDNIISVFPNPTNNLLYVDLGLLNANETDISIININGQIVETSSEKSQNTISIDLSNLAKGLYFLRLNTTEGIYTYKISVVD
ncbi:MAG: choice-of-anchor J domain-containing protein [Bacteroidales bacterium]|nr:choice-of-anchor J domain-containing protein [Bacteroidales bacterium]